MKQLMLRVTDFGILKLYPDQIEMMSPVGHNRTRVETEAGEYIVDVSIEEILEMMNG